MPSCAAVADSSINFFGVGVIFRHIFGAIYETKLKKFALKRGQQTVPTQKKMN